MAPDRLQKLRSDQSGAAIMEFSIVAGTMLVMLFGLVEFSHLFSQWNAAAKAVQVGARIAATSAPVWEDIVDLTGLEDPQGSDDPVAPGESFLYDYSITCTEDAGCVGTVGVSGVSKNYDGLAMDVLVFGRDPNNKSCNDQPGQYFGMCDVYKRIGTKNVRVTYEHTGAGYASRPGGLVPTITVEIIGLNFEFVLLDNILGLFTTRDLDQIPIPGLLTTSIAEDMRPGAPNF